MPGVEVHVRLRPIAGGNIWSSSDSLLFCNQKQDARFAFHRVHPASVTNATLYNTLEPLTHSAFSGQNVTVMAYGQTGSGKTHCMMGSRTDRGLVPRASRTLVDMIHAHSHEGASVECGYIEVYNENVYDLLAPKKREMILRDAADGNVLYVPKDAKTNNNNNNATSQDAAPGSLTPSGPGGFGGGMRSRSRGREGSAPRSAVDDNNNNNNTLQSSSILTQDAAAALLTGVPGATTSNGRLMVPVRTIEDFDRAVQLAENNRSYGETDLNSRSSRSHVILIFEITRRVAGQIQKSVLQFVDLAGSESAGRANTTGSALAEGGHINKSLLALGNVVTAIVEKRQVISYRESNLTRILRNCLGGKGLTYLICCVNPTKENYEQTYQSLKFAERAMNIKGDPGITLNMAPLIVHQVWRSLQGRMRMMKEREQSAYELGIQDTYNHCRQSIGEVVAGVDKEVQELMQEHQTLADAVLANDQQRALRAIQEAQQIFSTNNNNNATSTDAAPTNSSSSASKSNSNKNKNNNNNNAFTLENSIDALQREADREEKLQDKKLLVEQLRTKVEADSRQLEDCELQLGETKREYVDRRSELAKAQRLALDREWKMETIRIERQFWTELNAMVDDYYVSVVPAAERNQDSEQPTSAAAQLREVRNYKAQIDKEKKEIEELREALKMIADCIEEEERDNGSLEDLTDVTNAHLNSHIQSIEATQKANRSNNANQTTSSNSHARGISGSAASARASPTAAGTATLVSNSNSNNVSSGMMLMTGARGGSTTIASNPGSRRNNNNSNTNNAKSTSAVPSPRVGPTTASSNSRKGSRSPSPKNQPKPRQQSQQQHQLPLPSFSQQSNTTTTTAPAVTNNNNNNTGRNSSAIDLINSLAAKFSKEDITEYEIQKSRSTNNNIVLSQQQNAASTSTTNNNRGRQPPQFPPPRSPRPRHQTIGNNENFQPIPSNSANRAAIRKEQQRKTRMLDTNNNNGGGFSSSRSPTPPPHQNNMKQSGGMMNLKRTTNLADVESDQHGSNSKEASQSRAAVELNLFEYGQSPLAVSNKMGGGNNNSKKPRAKRKY